MIKTECSLLDAARKATMDCLEERNETWRVLQTLCLFKGTDFGSRWYNQEHSTAVVKRCMRHARKLQSRAQSPRSTRSAPRNVNFSHEIE